MGGYLKNGTLLAITNLESNNEICRHQIPLGKGNNVLNNNHKPDKAQAKKDRSLSIYQGINIRKGQSHL